MEPLYQQLPEALLPWYQLHARRLPWRADRQPYHVWISEIMLQQTRVETVKGYYERFLQTFPTVFALAHASEQQLLKCWEGLGYYNRARNLQKAARIVIDQYDGVFPQNYEQIIRLPGIGPYTAGAIASICFDQPKAAVDGNVLRVISRICAVHDPVDMPKAKQHVTQQLESVYPPQAGMFTQSLMELGALICTPDGKPKCGDCPAADFCRAKQLGIQTQLPKRMPKQPRRVEKLTVFILSSGGRLAICRREEQGLLAGLWQLPNRSGTQTDQQAMDIVRQWGLRPELLRKSVRRRHVFTHVEWEMTGFYIDCAAQTKRFVWVVAQQLEQAYPLPTAFRLFLESK